MRKRVMDFMGELRAQEFHCEADEEWKFTDGTAAACCTSSALLVAKQFNGEVLGYCSIDNPTATIGLPGLEGHDFALIRKRWLIDYWAWRVTRTIPSPILDLKDPDELSIAQQLYGPENRWSLVDTFA